MAGWHDTARVAVADARLAAVQAPGCCSCAGCRVLDHRPVNGMSEQWLYMLCITPPLMANNRANQAQLAAVRCHCAPTPA
jgi:hypothetical protein